LQHLEIETLPGVVLGTDMRPRSLAEAMEAEAERRTDSVTTP
jgi:hypothetical protein